MSPYKLQEIIDLEAQGYRATAIRQLRAYLRENPNTAEGWYYLARFLADPRKQLDAVDRAIKLDEEYAEANEFRAVLLEEYPHLESTPLSRRLITVVSLILLLVLAGAALALGVMTVLEEPMPEVIVVVPNSETPPATVPPLVVANPTDTESPIPTDSPTPIPSLTSNVTDAPIVSATPLLSETPTPSPADSVSGNKILIAFPDDDALSTELLAALNTTFSQNGGLFFDQVTESIDDSANAAVLLDSENAVLVIFGTTDSEQITLELYAQETPIPHPDLMYLMRIDTPWQISLEIPADDFSGNLGALMGAAAYLGYEHGMVIDSLEPLFSIPTAELDENLSLLAFMLAYSYQAVGQYEEALRVYDLLNTYTREPNPAVVANRAFAIAQTGDPESAIKLYLSLLESYPDAAFVESNIGVIHLMTGEVEAAQLAFEEAMRLDAEAPRPYVERGRLLLTQNQFNRALEDFSTSAQLDADFAPAYYELAKLRIELGLLDEALLDIDRAIALLPTIPEFYVLRGQILMQQGAWEPASTAFEQALRFGAESAELHAQLAAVYFELGNLDGTIRESNNALTLDQDNADAWYQRGRAYLAQNQLGSALNDFGQGLERDPEHVDLLVARCTTHARMGDDGAAAADCDSALALDGQNGAALEQRGLIRARAGDRASAASDFQEAIVYEPNAYEAYYYLGWYALQERRYEEAIRLLTRALDIAPFLGKAYAARGVAYRISNAWELAVADLEQALKIVPEDVYSYYELGLAKRAMADRAYESGNNAQARELYADASEAFLNFLNASQPNDPFVAEAQAALNYVNSALQVIDSQ